MAAELKALPLKTEFLRNATPIVLAIKCYKNDHGELPEELDDLVPKYLEAVTLDPFDGKPLRYSREQRIIYSVGTDLEDAGGAADASFAVDEKEPALRVNL